MPPTVDNRTREDSRLGSVLYGPVDVAAIAAWFQVRRVASLRRLGRLSHWQERWAGLGWRGCRLVAVWVSVLGPWVATWDRCTTLAGMRPRSLTAMPWVFCTGPDAAAALPTRRGPNDAQLYSPLLSCHELGEQYRQCCRVGADRVRRSFTPMGLRHRSGSLKFTDQCCLY